MKRFEVNATPILQCKRQHILRKNGILFYFLFEKKKQSRIDTHATIERIQFFKYNHAKKNWILWRAFKQKQQKLMEKNRI